MRRVHLSLSVLLCCLLIVHNGYAFDPFRGTFHDLHSELFGLSNANSAESLFWPFARHNSRDKLDAAGSSDAEVISHGDRDTEPLDLSFVEGPIVDPDEPQQAAEQKPPKAEANPANQAPPQRPTGGLQPQLPQFPDTSSLFNHHFGSFLGNDFFANPFAGFGGVFDFPRYQPWWKGPNVCKIREEDVEEDETKETATDREDKDGEGEEGFISSFQLNLESCVEKPNKYQCKKITNHGGKKRTYIVTYKCCAGFGRRRSAGVNSPCEKLELFPLDQTIEEAGAKEFMRSAKKTLSDGEMEGMTVFAPEDAGFTQFAESMFENNLVVVPLNKRTRREAPTSVNTKDLVHAHMVQGIKDIEEIENEQILTTLYNTTIRLNVFPRPPSERGNDFPFKYTANCVPITKPNKFATNGMVHVVKSVLLPPEKTVMEMLKERPDMAVFTTVLERTKLDVLLNDPTKHLTVLAPTDAAFEKLDPILRKKMKEGRGCASNILKNHILDLTFCSSAVAEDAKTSAYNMLGEKLEFEIGDEEARRNRNEIADMTSQNEIIVNGEARMLEADLMGTNGVVHIIDTMLPTDSAKPVTQTLHDHNSTVFEQLIREGNFEEYIDDIMNMTVFAPLDTAFETSEEGKKWLDMLEKEPAKLKNNEQLKKFIEYHMSQPMIKTSDLSDGQIESRTGNKLRLNLYATNFPFVHVMNRATVNCARLVHFDEDSCGSVVHQIDRVLEAPQKNLLQELESNEKYSTFLKLVRDAQLTDMLTEANQNLTLLVPKDEVFNELSDLKSELAGNKERLQYFIKSHMLPDVLCCTGISQSQWPFVRTISALSNASLRLNRDRRPKVQNAGITKCDIIATNGIIHEINDIIAVTDNKNRDVDQFQQHFGTFW